MEYQKLKYLQDLNLSYNPGVMKIEMEVLEAMVGPSLIKLILVDCNISADLLSPILVSCVALELLDLSYNCGSPIEFIAAAPNVKTLILKGNFK